MTVSSILPDKSILVGNIIRHVFNLSKKQLECFMNIVEMENSGTCILNLVDVMDSERSIIQKNLKVLMKKGLVERKSVTLTEFKERCTLNNREDISPKTNKGYLYIYSPLSSKELTSKIESILSRWNTTISEYFSTLQK
ncbi:hypothetical protein NEF87_004499 [Candidatus Lokiarchaeum ossiferum]|uniref:MarR family transcriptional regulator n=1 Tax=Candidatus Lokiarchaeum ossiferum TaxID=2951803 RepID=A0ABY6I067_9ARCH|nr:hypothetical protein NEF87_004499 [Candidatus Lokiarchaeum sp. B-35]